MILLQRVNLLAPRLSVVIKKTEPTGLPVGLQIKNRTDGFTRRSNKKDEKQNSNNHVFNFPSGCTGKSVKPVINCGNLNMAHLGYLYSEVKLENGTTGGIVHIYSEYPDYNYTIEPNEGFACVDDVARAVVLLCGCPDDSNSKSRQDMLDKMMDFILSMQSDSGYFYNFIWHDGSINKTYRTSQAVARLVVVAGVLGNGGICLFKCKKCS